MMHDSCSQALQVVRIMNVFLNRTAEYPYTEKNYLLHVKSADKGSELRYLNMIYHWQKLVQIIVNYIICQGALEEKNMYLINSEQCIWRN